MRLKNLAGSPLIAEAWLGQPSHELQALVCDSRQVKPGGAFYALQGLEEDGHAFVSQALEAGAAVLFVSDGKCYARLCEAPPEGLAGVLRIAPGRGALADLANLIADEPSRKLDLLGVTGTAGKTTVSHLVAQLYGALGSPCGVLGSLGIFLDSDAEEMGRTTPEAPIIADFIRHCVERGIGQAVMEATSIGIDLERTRGLHFRAAAFTNLSRDHLDYHGSLANYAAAKERLFLEYELGRAVLNVDDPAGRSLLARINAERPGLPVLTFGLGGDAQLRAEGVVADAGGSRGHICYEGQRAEFELALPGGFNLSNLLAAVGLMLAAGQPLQDLARAARQCKGVAGRFEHIDCGADFTVVVDYSHKPQALENALLTARQMARGRVLLVFGCGGERDRGKRPEMGEIAQRLADRVVITSDNPRGEAPARIMADIAAGLKQPPDAGGSTLQIEDRREAIHYALDEAGEGDVVLIAGKGHETYQEIGGEKLPFDDREVVRKWAGVC